MARQLKNAAVFTLYKVVLTTAVLSLFIISTSPSYAQSKIEIAVNNGIVTSYQISQRARFLRLTGFKGDARKEAKKQLINEELQFQEAKRVGFSLPQSAVDRAFGNLAKNNRTTSAVFSRALRQRGVNPKTLKDLIKARILWQEIVRARARAEGQREKQNRDVTSILFNRDGDGENKTVKEYTLEQIVFILNKDASKSKANQRLREVESFRQSNSSCEGAIKNARKLAKSGVVTKSLGRFTPATMTPEIRKAVDNAKDALFTAPKRSVNGIEILAICNTREIVDNSGSDVLNFDISQLSTTELKEKSEKWMGTLRDRAVIRQVN